MTDTYDFGNGLVPAYKHTKGGGWVAHTAIVDDTVCVGPDARVYEDAVVYENALITENARIYGNVLVTDNAQVFGNARVYGNAEVSEDAQVFGNAEVSGYAKVSGNTEISGDAVVYGDITNFTLEREDDYLDIIRRHENMTMSFEDTASGEMQKLIDGRPAPFPGRYVTDDGTFWDEERAHIEADKILCRELRKHGRDNLVDLFNKVSKHTKAEADKILDEIKIVDRFDLEQDIFKCWHLVDDLDQLIEMVMDRDASNDTISNVLIGLSALYGDRFQKLMNNFEELIANEKI